MLSIFLFVFLQNEVIYIHARIILWAFNFTFLIVDFIFSFCMTCGRGWTRNVHILMIIVTALFSSLKCNCSQGQYSSQHACHITCMLEYVVLGSFIVCDTISQHFFQRFLSLVLLTVSEPHSICLRFFFLTPFLNTMFKDSFPCFSHSV